MIINNDTLVQVYARVVVGILIFLTIRRSFQRRQEDFEVRISEIMGLKHKELRNHRDLERRRKRIVFERENETLLNKASESDSNAIEAYNNKMREVDKEIKSSQINLDSFDKVIKDVTGPFEKRSHRYRRLKRAETI